ncbi:hypothetical protein HanRHA438_Chr12g0569381 [Helianthus annuus]|nr:hypothetical protein HanIR_Chr12g0602371 [Helianthus annuus]KAJ0867982.1 hypothetical protein HanRHA438_Chr12g0569381 [Helianthus annuus]
MSKRISDKYATGYEIRFYNPRLEISKLVLTPKLVFGLDWCAMWHSRQYLQRKMSVGKCYRPRASDNISERKRYGMDHIPLKNYLPRV